MFRKSRQGVWRLIAQFPRFRIPNLNLISRHHLNRKHKTKTKKSRKLRNKPVWINHSCIQISYLTEKHQAELKPSDKAKLEYYNAHYTARYWHFCTM